MRITKISLEGFRAFDVPFELDLDGGKNLLLHGENGSGKSSLFLALKRFFEERGDDIAAHRNHFSPDTRTSGVRLCVQRTDATGTPHDHEFHWDTADGHPLPVPKDTATAPISPELRSLLVGAAKRAGFLDYRSLLRTSYCTSPLSRSHRGPQLRIYGDETTGLNAQLFDLVTLVVLEGVRVTLAGGRSSTVGDLMRDVWANRPVSRHKRTLQNANRLANTFNSAFNAILPDVEMRLSEFLAYFENHQLEVKLLPVSLSWDKLSLELLGAELKLELRFRGIEVQNHHHLLNEARLSALALSLFLAGVQLADTDAATALHPRFLVLDDTLLGLELQNRLPLLRILESDAFQRFQIILLTHDRVWFDLARGHLQTRNGWIHKELLADEDTGVLIPRLCASESDLERARVHLRNGDLKAAAVYARSAFEWKLRKVCENNGIKIPFKAEPERIGAGALWDGIVLRQRDRETQRASGSTVNDFVPQSLEQAVETMRSTVLNRLSHSGSSGLVAVEVSAAISTVGQLHQHTFPRATSPNSAL
ncbi:MAG: AAA family ATPase [Puniceicoccaceae bacterium]